MNEEPQAAEAAEVDRIYREHVAWVETRRDAWAGPEDSYQNDFFRHRNDGAGKSGPAKEEGGLVEFQKNRLIPWMRSYTASLFASNLQTTVMIEDEAAPAGADAKAVQAALDSWLNRHDVKRVLREAFKGARMKDRSALALTVEDDPRRPLGRVCVEMMSAEECVWDRNVRHAKDHRYMGRLRWWPKEKVQEMAEKAQGRWDVPAELATVRAPTLDENGLKGQKPAQKDDDSSSVGVLELYQPFEAVEVAVKKAGPGRPKKDGAPVVKGVYSVWLLNQGSPDAKGYRGHHRAYRGAAPFAKPSGAPLIPIIPMVLENLPGRPYDGIPEAMTVYEHNKEENYVGTYMARAFRLDAARKYAYDDSRLQDEKDLAKLNSAKDLEGLAVSGDPNNVIAPITFPPLSETSLKYYELQQQAIDQVHGTAPVTRGETRPYITATQSLAANDYTETSIGELKERLDSILSETLAGVLCVLGTRMTEDSFTIASGGESLVFKREYCALLWRISITNLASTPMARAQARTEFGQAMPLYNQAIAVAFDWKFPEPVRQAAAAQADHIVKLWNLPESFKVANVMAVPGMYKLPPPPAPEPGPSMTSTPAAPAQGVVPPGVPVDPTGGLPQ